MLRRPWFLILLGLVIPFLSFPAGLLLSRFESERFWMFFGLVTVIVWILSWMLVVHVVSAGVKGPSATLRPRSLALASFALSVASYVALGVVFRFLYTGPPGHEAGATFMGLWFVYQIFSLTLFIAGLIGGMNRLLAKRTSSQPAAK